METKRICPSCQKPLPPDVPMGLCPECLLKSGFNTGTEPDNPGKQSGFVPPPVEELRKLFPQLEIVELIGKGGMGAVYKARQPSLDRSVALKILPPGAADDPGFAERFNREARALARLSHPHIVAVHDFGQTGGQPYLVMEFVDGPNLRQVEQAGRLTPEQALQIVPQICEALQFAHNEGVVHRDIKPENILLDKKGRVKITDFGIAKIVGVPASKVSLTGAKDVLGTPHYMAPEQIEKPATVDHRADIYSLGVVFYELLTGELPLGKFQPPSKKVHIDVRLDEVVLHALEKEPALRYQHASEVQTDVETIAAGAPKAEGRTPKPELRQPPLTSAVAIHNMVKTPANWLVATGILNWIAIPLVVLVTAGILGGKGYSTAAAPMLLVLLAVLVLSSAMIVAGLKMKRLEAYPLVIIGSILAILVTPGNIIGLPIGIWCLVVLCRREVREAFNGKLPPDLFPSGAAAAPVPRPDRFWRRFAVAIALVLLALIMIPVGAVLLSITLPALSRAKFKMQQRSGTEESRVSMTFGPVVERTLNDLDDGRGAEALNLRTGQLLSLPADFGKRNAEERENWLNSNRVDLLVDYARDRWALLSRGVRFRDLREPDLGWGGVWPESEVLEKRENREGTFYLLPANAQPPLTFAFLTANGEQGWLQITGLFTNDPRGMKLRYRLTQLAAGGGGGSVASAGQNAQRTFVRLVVDKTAMTFEGQSTSWENLGALLAKVPDRKNTVLEFAVTSDQITVAQQNEWFQKATALARQHGFEYASFIGIHPLGSKGAATVFAQAKPGEYRVELTSGVTAEIAALTSTPRASMAWWQPDGTLLKESPGDRLEEFSTFCPSGKAIVEFAVVIKFNREAGQELERLPLFDPQPQYVAWEELFKGDQSVGRVAVVGFRSAPTNLVCRIGLAEGEWQRVATWDGAGTLLNNETGGPLQLVRSGDEHTTCAKLAHRVDPNRFAVRFVARLKDGHKVARVGRIDYGGAQEARICGLLEGMRDSDVVAYELYRIPLRWAAIPGLAIKPAVPALPPLKDAPEGASRGSAATFVPVMVTISNLVAAENWAEMMRLFPQAIRRTDKANAVEGDIQTHTPVLLEWDMSLPMAFVTGMEKRPMPEFKPGSWLEFPADRDRVNVYLRHDPWPHAAWRFHLEILDDEGTAVQQLDHTIENTGRRPPKRQWTVEQSQFSGALGRGVLDRAKRFRLSVESLWTEQEGEFRLGVELPLYFGLSTADYTGMFRPQWLKVDATNTEAVVHAQVAEWPKSRWNLRLELFNGEGHPAGDGETVAENGGWIVSRVATGEREFRFPVKNLGIEARAPSRFRLRVEAIADPPKSSGTDVQPPASSSADMKLAAEKVAVEDLALRLLAAIRDKEDDVLQSLAVDRIKGWRASLPHFAFEARERFQQMRGRPVNLLPTDSLIEGEYAVVKCDDPKATNQIYLVLQFVRTEHGWKNWSLRNSPPTRPLAEHLKQLPPDGPAGTAKPNR